MKKAITVMVLVLLILAVPVKSQEILQDQNIEMVLVEKGSFEMGDVFELVSLAVNNVHTATFTYDFYIGKYEVTFDQYDRYCQETKKATPDDNGWGRGSRPVINVSWYDAIAYCNWLSEKEGLAKAYDETGTLIDSNGKITTDPSLIEGYRLPTEAEWEYAARGGNKSKGYKYSGSNKADDVAWYKKNSGGTTHEVGTKQPNELGIYDMSGNIDEWCIDIYGWWAGWEDERSYRNVPTVNQCYTDCVNDNFDRYELILRGSCYKTSEFYLPLFFRDGEYPYDVGEYYGFRLARTEPHETIWEKDSNTKLKIDASQEDAQVYLNGKYIGTAPVSIDTKCMHNAQIKVVKEGYEEKIIKNVYIPKNETVQVYAELKKKEPQMVLVEKGSFDMGGKDDSRDWLRKYAHKVTLTYDFYIGKYEVTHDQYYRYCEETRREMRLEYFLIRKSNYPAAQVSWYDAIGYCNWLSEKEGLAKAYDEKGNFLDKNGNITTDPDRTEGYRLPTEAEWEYAAKGGNKSNGYKYSGSNNPDDVAWYGEFFITGTAHEVGTKQPNELGIYDMSGNVSEWCNDEDSYYTSSSDQINPYVFPKVTSEKKIFRITRGGDWHSDANIILNYYRWNMYSARSDSYTGFRIVRVKP